jgi:hypothetical protein
MWSEVYLQTNSGLYVEYLYLLILQAIGSNIPYPPTIFCVIAVS